MINTSLPEVNKTPELMFELHSDFVCGEKFTELQEQLKTNLSFHSF